MNLNLYGVNDKWIVVDVGITFGDDLSPPGIEIICPDISCLHSIQDRVIGILITHAHEDHVGALPYLWRQLNAPIFCTAFTATVAKRKLEEVGLSDRVLMHQIRPGSPIQLGDLSIEWVSLTHSVPEAHGLVIAAFGQLVFHTGDWKLDPHPIEGYNYDDKRLIELGAQGVDFVVGDSTNAVLDGWSGSEKECWEGLHAVIAERRNRVAVTCFSSNTARLACLGYIARKTGRQVTLLGRSLFNYFQTAKTNGYLTEFPQLVSAHDLDYLPRSEQLILATGSQGEPRAAISKLATGDHPDLFLEEGDTVVFSSKVIPGNEKKLFRLYDLLSQKRIEVVTEADAPIHVSGHPCRDELRWLYRALRPKVVIPVHGEERHMRAHADLADSLGLESLRVVNGQITRLKYEHSECVCVVKTGRLGLSGNHLVSLSCKALTERRILSEEGLMIVSIVFDKKCRLVSRPMLSTVGVTTGEIDLQSLVSDLQSVVEEIVSDLSSQTIQSDEPLIAAIQQRLGNVIRQWLGSKPKLIANVVRI